MLPGETIDILLETNPETKPARCPASGLRSSACLLGQTAALSEAISPEVYSAPESSLTEDGGDSFIFSFQQTLIDHLQGASTFIGTLSSLPPNNSVTYTSLSLFSR